MRKLIILSMLLISTLVASTKLDKVSVQLIWKHQFEFAGFYMAKEKGFYKELNLDVNIKEFQQGINISKDVENGVSTFGVAYPTLILEKSNGADIILLNAIFQSSPHILITLEKSGIKTIQDFKNKKIMLENGSIANAPFLSMLLSQKSSLDEMELIQHTFNLEDLINEKVDIYSAYSSNELYTLDSLGIKYNVFDPKNFGFDFYNNFTFTSATVSKKNPELVSRFQRATIKGWEYAYSNIEETIKVIQEKYNTQNKSYQALNYEAKVLKELAFINNIPLGNIEASKLERIKDVYGLMGLLKNDFDVDSFIFDDSKIYLSQEEKEFIQNTTLKVSVSKDFKPISFQNTNGTASGISTEYWEILAKKLGLNMKYKFEGVFSNQLKSIKEKQADIILSIGKTKERENYALFTDEYVSFPIAIATKNSENFIEDFSKVIDKKIAVGRNFTAHKLLIKKYPNINFIFVENIKDGLKLVRQGKVFGFVDMKPTLSYNIKKPGFEDIKIAGNTGTTFKVSIMIRDDYPLLKSALNKAIDSVEVSDLLQIIKVYENVKFEKAYDYKAFFFILCILFIVILFIIFKHYFLNKANKNLQIIVDEKTKNLKELNETLEDRIKKAIEENSKKDAVLFQQTKNAQMGEMIGNIAHQWRQPLSLISTAASGIQAQKLYGTITPEKEDEALNAIIEKVNFLSNTIDIFRDYIKEKKELKDVILQDRLNNDIQIIEASLTNNYIVLRKNIDTSEPIQISILAGELSQVIINILNNAKDILVERKIETPIIKISLVKQNYRAIISIEDNAGGIKDEIFTKIFNPYFTTKHQSNGTGLGLYMSKEIVEKHLYGKLYVENTKRGAKFIIELPLS
jgi:signal transduction histidine kinase/ABC-type nitrate/sulfonate/bicarbonate transport system substrate-binding protein